VDGEEAPVAPGEDQPQPVGECSQPRELPILRHQQGEAYLRGLCGQPGADQVEGGGVGETTPGVCA
jgi:hypothetical protein